MRRVPLMLLAGILLASLPAVPAPAAPAAGGHQVRLVDGSVLQGTLLLVDESRVVLRTVYADSLTLPRAQVAAILLRPDLAGGPATAAPPAGVEADAEPAETIPAGVGTLELAIKGNPVRSSARFQRDGERAAALELGALHLWVYADGKLIHHESDTSFEKEFRRSNWIYLRNHHRFPPVRLELPSGVHELRVVVGNRMDAMAGNESQPELISAEALIEALRVMPDQVTSVVLQGKGSRFGYGKYELEVLSSR
ncbi:MAG: hypothetical protein JW819_03340 [Candidatus Krumholzibacteriota bacterium]|nr:hypothetical protein [Candidatus Krumholzibacteriota bacterium]